jgi:hypothetical protein
MVVVVIMMMIMMIYTIHWITMGTNSGDNEFGGDCSTISEALNSLGIFHDFSSLLKVYFGNE